MWEVVVKNLADLDCVIGFDVGIPCESRGRPLAHPDLGVDDERTAQGLHRPSVPSQIRLQNRFAPFFRSYVLALLIYLSPYSSVLSIRFPVVYACSGVSDRGRILDSLLPTPNSANRV